MSLSGVNKGTAAAPVRLCQGEQWPSCAQQEGLCSMSSNTCVSAITAGRRHRRSLHVLRRYISLDGCHLLWLDVAPFLEHLLFLWLAPGRGGAMSDTVLFHLLPLQGCFWVCSTPSTHNPLRKTAVSAGWLRGDDQPFEVEVAQRSTYKGHCLHHQVYRALIRGSSFTKFKIGISHLFSWEPSELSERCGFTICMSCSCLQLYTMCFPLWSGRTVCLKTMFKSICFLKLTNTPRYDFPLGIKPATQAALIPSFPISVLFSFFPLSTHLSFLCFF